MRNSTLINEIKNLKTSTEVKEERDKEGTSRGRRVVTTFQFEAEVSLDKLAFLHRLSSAGVMLHALIGERDADTEEAAAQSFLRE